MSCWYSGPIAENSAAPDVQITVMPDPQSSQLETTVSVTPKGAVDPSVANNTVALTTVLTRFKLSGGGLGCSAAPAGSVGAAGFLGTLLGLLGLRRRRRL